ncbi:MAG TPA: hypothetical protein VFJ74_01500 [Gemmatimonadaceae bacterium]|nr:hypothetical protein [Gemmatimonadaceae bacterium]
MNVLAIAALADGVAAQLSRDALAWRPEHLVRAPASQPIALRFEFASPRPPFAAALLDALRLRVAAPYTSAPPAPAGAAIVAATPERGAEVTVTLRYEDRDDEEGAGIGYELSFAAKPTAARRGWLSVESDA